MINNNWFKNAIIYHVLIDRFAGFKKTNNWDKPIFLGGNIKGLIEKLDYLIDLGIDTIWMSPFYKTSEYHGYHITDFFSVDPRFGSEDDIKNLIDLIHQNKMKIIADFVPNHCSSEHPFFKEAQKNNNSEFKKWFYFKKWPNKYLCFLSVKQLPKLNLNNLDTKNYIINAAKHWLSLGLDGFRLDHVIGLSNKSCIEFNSEIKRIFPKAILIGEAWMKGIKFFDLKTIKIRNKYLKWLFGSSSDILLKEYKKIFDGVLDFRFQELIKEYIAYKKLKKKYFFYELKKHYKYYPNNFYLPTFLDNHDMNRFIFECGGDLEKLKSAAKIQFEINQPCIIYYGTEIGLSQNKSIWEFSFNGDLQSRMPMSWNNQNQELKLFYKNLISIKKENIFK